MRHGKKFNHLSRKTGHRKAMLSNMACSLIEHKRINTTVAKAKALRTFVEPIITKSKDDSTHSRRVVFSYLKNKYAVSELFREVAPKVADRPGGYIRIIKTGNRLGDNAEMAMVELVDFNELYSNEKSTKKKTRRRRGGSTKKAAADSATETTTTTEETVAETKEEAKPKAESKVEAEPKTATTEEAKPKAKKAAPKAKKKEEASEAKEEKSEDKKEDDKKGE